MTYLPTKKMARRVSALACLVAMALATPMAIANTSQREKAYQRAKETMTPDLYLIYRISERIATANRLKRPVRVAVRRGLDCEGTLGISQQSSKCQALTLLPDVDKATNFDIWAAQVVGTMKGSPNAFAFSDAGTIFVNVPMLKELAGKPHQLACVVGHELAHVTQNHSEEARRVAEATNGIAATKIAQAVKRAHGAQNAERTFALIMSGVAAGLSGNNSSLYQTQYAIALENMSAQLQAPAIAQEALKYSPQIAESINGMQGLSSSYIKRTVPDINNYLRDATLAQMGFSRSQEYEADLLGVEYVVAAGFSGKDCERIWSETMPHDQDKLIARLLPQGVEDPGLSANDVSAEEQLRQAALVKEERDKANQCRGTAIECQQERQRVSKGRESDQVPPEVLKYLMRSHPSNPDRAKAIADHASQSGLMNKLSTSGKSALASNYIRNWSYDAQGETVVIHEQMVHPKDAGLAKTGTSGIDIDKVLGF
jgi:Zn-dependent protease with chaperone function